MRLVWVPGALVRSERFIVCFGSEADTGPVSGLVESGHPEIEREARLSVTELVGEQVCDPVVSLPPPIALSVA